MWSVDDTFVGTVSSVIGRGSTGGIVSITVKQKSGRHAPHTHLFPVVHRLRGILDNSHLGVPLFYPQGVLTVAVRAC